MTGVQTCALPICPLKTAADNNGHLAVAFELIPNQPTDCAPPIYIATYTINPKTGEISTTNTIQNVPSYHGNGPMEVSFDGKYLAVGSTIYRFNGAQPLTPFGGVHEDLWFDQIAWDKTDHLYALNYASAALYTFGVSAKGVVTVASPVKLAGTPYGLTGMAVVPY